MFEAIKEIFGVGAPSKVTLQSLRRELESIEERANRKGWSSQHRASALGKFSTTHFSDYERAAPEEQNDVRELIRNTMLRSIQLQGSSLDKQMPSLG